MRNDCILSNLSDQQKDQLYDWLCDLGYAETKRRLAQPPPEGFGINAHRNTLFRFYSSYSRELHRATLPEIAPNAPDLLERAHLLSASKSALAHSIYGLAHSPSEPQQFNQLSRAIYRQELLALKQAYLAIAEQHAAIARERAEIERQRLKLAEIKFRFEASNQVACHAVKIKKILQDKQTSVEDKIWQVSDIVFGPSPDAANYHSLRPAPNATPPAPTE